MNKTTKTTVTVGVTHGGIFHSDDVFSAALLKILFGDDFKIVRTLKVDEYTNREDVIVFDIGLGKFDHHQPDSEVREDGTPYAAFGLLWREFGEMLVSDVNAIDELICRPVDIQDNGGDRNLMSQMISTFVPAWDSSETMDDAFERAVDVAKLLLKQAIEKQQAFERADAEAIICEEKSVADGYGNIVVMDRYVPISSIGKCTNARYMIYPSLRGGWNAQTVSRDEDRVLFPEDLLVNKPEWITFIHKGLFLMSSDNKDKLIDYCMSLSK